MPQWLTVLIAVIGAISTLFGIFGFSAYIAERAKHKAGKKNKKDDEEELKVEKEKLDNLRIVIREEGKPINDKLDRLTKEVNASTRATITSLRCLMKQAVDRCYDKGYASISEKASWMDLYNDYRALGGNHFKEYVDRWKNQMENFPDEPKNEK